MSDVEGADRLSSAVGASGRRGLRDLRLLWSVGAITLLGVAAALFLHEPPSTDHRELESRSEQLTELADHDTRAMLLIYQFLAQPDVMSGAATEIGTSALSAQNDASSLWRKFSARPPVLEGEAELRARYLELLQAAEAWGDDLATGGTYLRLDDPVQRAAAINAASEHTIVRVEALAGLRSLYADAIVDATVEQQESTDALRQDVTIAVVCGLLVLLFAFLLLERSGRRRSRMLVEVESMLEDEGARTSLERQLNRALEICNDERSAYRILERAVDQVLPDGGAELLVADSSQAHLAEVARTVGSVSCQVATPADCPAVRRAHTQAFQEPDALDACPQVRERGGDLHTTCVPFTVAGSSVGVLQVSTPRSLSEATVTHVELIARKTGERVGVARAFAKSQDQARTDPLTGLLNRRSLEEVAREIVESGRQYAVVFADLDHFKTLNDVHGHDAGDRALRLFSRCVREAVRPADAAARYGGEEFVLVLPDCDADGAAAVIARLREGVEHSLHAGTVPRFTSSFGIAEAAGAALADVVARADAALLAAKRSGRNRSVVWSPDLGAGRVDHTEPGDGGDVTATMIDDGTRAGEPAAS